MPSAIATKLAEAEVALKDLVDTRASYLKLLEQAPDDPESLETKNDLDGFIADAEATVIDLHNQVAKEQAASAPAEQPKWRREDHPAFQPKTNMEDSAAKSTPTIFKVNDIVEARYTDRSWYKAKITMITGSSAAPKYRVNYVGYGSDSRTVESGDIRPLLNESKKRKADGVSVTPAAATMPANPAVLSAAAKINPEFASQARQGSSKANDENAKPTKKSRKVGNSKALEASKSKWHEFQTKGPGKKKDSMFRTGQAPGARVGFTGSGSAMRKDPTRGRHIYQAGGDDDTLG